MARAERYLVVHSRVHVLLSLRDRLNIKLTRHQSQVLTEFTLELEALKKQLGGAERRQLEGLLGDWEKGVPEVG